jgi:hypothetical protein
VNCSSSVRSSGCRSWVSQISDHAYSGVGSASGTERTPAPAGSATSAGSSEKRRQSARTWLIRWSRPRLTAPSSTAMPKWSAKRRRKSSLPRVAGLHRMLFPRHRPGRCRLPQPQRRHLHRPRRQDRRGPRVHRHPARRPRPIRPVLTPSVSGPPRPLPPAFPRPLPPGFPQLMPTHVTCDTAVTPGKTALALVPCLTPPIFMLAKGLVPHRVVNPSRASKSLPKHRVYHDREGSLVRRD